MTRKRSPNYPRIDLGQAVHRTKALYQIVERGEFTQTDAAHSWGYKGANGLSRGAFAALGQYGLIEQKKGGIGKITGLGLTIALREETAPEYRRALAEAAKEPPLFAELFDEGRASDAHDALLHYLVTAKGFTTDGASRFIEVLKATKAIVPTLDGGVLDEPGGIEPPLDESDSGEEAEQQRYSAENSKTVPSPDRTHPDRTKVPLRLAGGYEVVIDLPESMPESAWEHLIAYLGVMKGGYVRELEEPSEEEPNDEE